MTPPRSSALSEARRAQLEALAEETAASIFAWLDLDTDADLKSIGDEVLSALLRAEASPHSALPAETPRLEQSDIEALRQATRWADERVSVAGCSIDSVTANERDKARHLRAMNVAANLLEWLKPVGARVPATWSEFGDGHDYSRTGKHDPNQCRICLRQLRQAGRGRAARQRTGR